MLKYAETSYEEIFHKTSDGIYVHDAATGKVLDVNERACELTGYTREELLSGNPADLVTGHPDYTLDKAITYIGRASTCGPQQFEWLGKHKNGGHHWYEVYLKPATISGRENVLAFFREIDERQKAEEKMVESERRLRHTLDNMLEGAQIIGFDWRYLYVNNVLVVQSKYSREELLGHTMMERYPGIEHTAGFAKYRQCMEERIPSHIENEFVFPDGTSCWFELRIEPVPEGIFILSADISERKKAELEMQHANELLEARVAERTQMLTSANKTLEAFSYSVSHDLRSPLRIIDGYAMILEKEHSHCLDEEGQRLISVIRSSTVRMGKLIDDILEFAKLGQEQVKRGPVDMKALAEATWREQYELTDGRAQVSIGDLHPAHADRALIGQVFTNLVSNALKYSSRQEKPLVTITSVLKEEETIYAVHDNGTGFDMLYADKLFHVFQRLHKQSDYPGSGVGLAITESIVQRHGGRIWAESKPGGGATFSFALPHIHPAALQ